MDLRKKMKTKTIIYGGIGRHNFGDLLFPHIISFLLNNNSPSLDIKYCDVLSSDMSKYGGHNVESIGKFLTDKSNLNVIVAGGEVGGCSMKFAKQMFAENDNLNIEELNNFYDAKIRVNSRHQLAYLLSKTNFKNPKMFVANSIGGCDVKTINVCSQYDYVGFREKNSYLTAKRGGIKNAFHVPDCAVLTKKLFHKIISDRKSEDEIKTLKNNIGNNYIAIQLNQNVLKNKKIISNYATQLNSIISVTNLPIVFFCAGCAWGHDSKQTSFDKLSDNLPTGMSYFFNGLNIWDICNLISNAKCVISTSLHVRILSTIYARPRFSVLKGNKHLEFIENWDCIKNSNIELSDIAKQVTLSLAEHDIEADNRNCKMLENTYLKNSQSWVDKIMETKQ